jgi:3-oxoadipate enol-lactonase
MKGQPPLLYTVPQKRKLAWRECGEGPALVFIHGMGGNSRNWKTQYQHFSSRFRVIGWDAPGYGGSDDWDTDQPRVKDYVEEILTFLNILGVEKAHLVGHSFGGTLMPAFKKKYPDRVESMVLAQPVIGSGLFGPIGLDQIIQGRERLLKSMGAEKFSKLHAPKSVAVNADAQTIKKAIEVTSWMRPTGYLAQWRAMAHANIFEEIPQEPGPTTVVLGTEDKTASREVVTQILEVISGARLAELQDVGHMIYIEHPSRFNKVLEEHFTKL